jgi:hypothetical protein
MTDDEGKELCEKGAKTATAIAEHFTACIVLMTYDDEPDEDGDSNTHSFFSYRGELHACLGMADTFIAMGGAVPSGQEDEHLNVIARAAVALLKPECTGIVVLGMVDEMDGEEPRATFTWSGSFYAMMGLCREFIHMKLRSRDEIEKRDTDKNTDLDIEE